MGLTRREHFATALNRLYPGENWKYGLQDAIFRNEAGLAISEDEIHAAGDGLALKMLVDAKRDAFEAEQLGNALTWLIA